MYASFRFIFPDLVFKIKQLAFQTMFPPFPAHTISLNPSLEVVVIQELVFRFPNPCFYMFSIYAYVSVIYCDVTNLTKTQWLTKTAIYDFLGCRGLTWPCWVALLLREPHPCGSSAGASPLQLFLHVACFMASLQQGSWLLGGREQKLPVPLEARPAVC